MKPAKSILEYAFRLSIQNDIVRFF